MIGENLKLEKALITETNLQQNQTDRDYQLWQVSLKNLTRQKVEVNLGRLKLGILID